MKALVAGWFSFEGAGATAGDLLAKDLVCDWLMRAGYSYDVALAPPLSGGIDWTSADPDEYSHVVFVCGPFFKSNLLQRFERCHLVGVNLSMMEPVHEWNPFDLLIERDSSSDSNPDITFAASESPVPVVGIVLLKPEEKAAVSELYARANEAILRFAAKQEIAIVNIDTALDRVNEGGLRSPGEIESLIAQMDVVLTTRLHGMVLALRNGVPVIALDPVSGGGKIRQQARAIGWPLAFSGDVTDQTLLRAFEFCLTEDARAAARRCAADAATRVAGLRDAFVSAMRSDVTPDGWGDGRRRRVWLEPPPMDAPARPARSWSKLAMWLRRA